MSAGGSVSTLFARRICWTLVALVSAILVTLSACSVVDPIGNHSRITTGPDGFRTFNPVREIGGSPMLCAAFGIVEPVHGLLAGQEGAREPVWLVADGGRQLSVVYPAAFFVRFEPMATLYSNTGDRIARAGEDVELSQTSWVDAAGTFDDPYIAAGIVFNGCYPFVN